MDYRLTEALNLIFRWFHVVIGVLWIGQTAFFSWLDSRFTVEKSADGKEGPIWMVHSGGFYVVEKQKVPELLPRHLHWFKWEAALSWISGILLLALVYYHGQLVIDPSSDGSSLGLAIGIGVGTLVLGWVVYDLLWISPLENREMPGTLISLGLVVGVAWGLSQAMPGRAAYIHVGALFGTIMAANVWMRILPAQRDLIAAVREGRAPDLSLAARAKQRSKHNTFMAVPLIFIMISSHFPTTSYGHRLNWILLLGFILLGFLIRKGMNHWNHRPLAAVDDSKATPS